MKKSPCLAVILSMALLLPLLPAAEDEDALFGDAATVVDISNIAVSSVSSNLEADSVSISGLIYNRTTYAMNGDWIRGDAGFKANSLLTYLQGDIMLDIRLRKNIKTFVNLSAYYSPQGQASVKNVTHLTLATNGYETNRITQTEVVNTLVFFKEFFLDANIRRAVYFRIGKQVLQWGRGYFWNPTDLINIERKNFFNMTYNREGTYGVKLHAPFGSSVNLYSFADFSGAKNLDDFAVAGKAEVLLGGTEIALSAWGRKHRVSVYGLDFSSQLLGIDLWGEVSASYGDNQKKLKVTESVFPAGYLFSLVPVSGRWVAKASLGLSKSFDIEIQDRLMVTAELFWNSGGYAENMLDAQKKTPAMFGPQVSLRDFFLASGAYVPGYYGRYYAALFASFAKFFVQDLTWSVNGIMNIDDLSAVVATGWTWAAVYNFSIGLNINVFIGEEDTEYGMSGNLLSTDLSLSINF